MREFRNDDWGLAVALKGIIRDAAEALMWIGERDGHEANRRTHADHALKGVRDYATEIECHWNRRQKANNALCVTQAKETQ